MKALKFFTIYALGDDSVEEYLDLFDKIYNKSRKIRNFTIAENFCKKDLFFTFVDKIIKRIEED